jgi:integrase/recombinase XerD
MLRVEKNLSPNSISAYKGDLIRYLDFLSNKQSLTDLDDIRQVHIRSFIRYLNDAQLAPVSITRSFSSIRSYHEFLSMEKLVKKNPTQLLDPPKLPKKIPQVLSVIEIEAIINAVDIEGLMGYRDKAVLEILYSAGLRVSELCQLILQKDLSDIQMLRVIGKKKKERFVPIGDKAIQVIDNYLKYLRQKLADRGKHDGCLFLSNNGKPLTRMTVYNILKKWSEAAGITKRVYPHILRHSFATHLLDGGANLREVQLMLGHVDISTTQIYTHHDKLFLTSEVQKFHPRW